MFRRIALLSTAILISASLAAAAQQPLPQEPRGEDSSRSATPRNQLSGPDVATDQRSAPGTTGLGGQNTPQEPRGEESSRSSTPTGDQPRSIPGQRREK
jgi:hypothetical protein